MQSFHHSRGRILFEVFCSLAISASCAAAWQQTGATALLPAAFVAAFYGLVHAFDMRRPRSTTAAASRPVDLERIPEPVVPADQPTFVSPTPAELQLTADDSIGEVEKVDPAPPRASRPRRPKAAPKGSRRRPSAREEKVTELPPPEEAQVIETALPAEVQVAEIAPPEAPEISELGPSEEAKVARPTPSEDEQASAPWRPDETSPVPLRPLFEPEPFVRQQRAAFGRKA
jgi:hypothetical protein